MLKPELNEPVGANAPLLPIHTATVVANHEGEDEMGSRSMTVGRYEEIRRRLDEGRGGHETFMRELRSGFAIAQRQALTKVAKAERLGPAVHPGTGPRAGTASATLPELEGVKQTHKRAHAR